MGERQNKLTKIVNHLVGSQRISKPSTSDILSSKYSNNIFQTYSALDGQLNEPPTKFGAWDISTSKFIVELDEERHFNRYRLITLNSPFYDTHEYFSLDSYKDYCKGKEANCIKSACWGKNWKNDSTEKQFSKSDTQGVLTGNGSSRWKQRAYYDFLKDISSRIINIPVIRISIYDTYKNQNLDQLLKANQDELIYEMITLKLTNFT